jgi:hypothetical protein
MLIYLNLLLQTINNISIQYQYSIKHSMLRIAIFETINYQLKQFYYEKIFTLTFCCISNAFCN